MWTHRRADRAVPIALFLLIVTILIAACSSGGSAASMAPAAPAAGDGAGEGEGFGGDGDQRSEALEPGASAPTGASDPLGAVDDAKIIRTGTMDLEVDDVAAAVRAARDAIRGMGGYVGASQTSNVDDKPYAEVTYRIPVDRWEDALDALRALKGIETTVVSEQTDSVDVTGQVVDLEARIRNLRASERALQGIAEEAVRVSDLLEVQAQITNVRGQIEQLEAQRNQLADRTAYATLSVSYQLPVVAAIEVQAEGWDPAAIFDEASASLIGLLQALAGAAIWLVVVWLPILAMLALTVGIGAWLLRRFGVLDRAIRPAPPASAGD